MAYSDFFFIKETLWHYVCIFKCISVFVFQFLNDVESGVFESFIVGNISLNKGLMLETYREVWCLRSERGTRV